MGESICYLFLCLGVLWSGLIAIPGAQDVIKRLKSKVNYHASNVVLTIIHVQNSVF